MADRSRAISELFESASLGAPENAVGFVMWRVLHRYQREVDRAVAPLGLTHLQFVTLVLAAWLGRSGGAATQAELARFGDVQPMQVSHMLRALAGKGLVARPRNAADVRGKRVEVTAAGLAVLARALPAVIDVQQRVFGDAGRVGGDLLATLLRLDGQAKRPVADDGVQPRKPGGRSGGLRGVKSRETEAQPVTR